jgi:hypothetical protein
VSAKHFFQIIFCAPNVTIGIEAAFARALPRSPQDLHRLLAKLHPSAHRAPSPFNLCAPFSFQFIFNGLTSTEIAQRESRSLKFDTNFRQIQLKSILHFILVFVIFYSTLISINLYFYFVILRAIKTLLPLSPQHGETTNDKNKKSGNWTLGHRNQRRSGASCGGYTGQHAHRRQG